MDAPRQDAQVGAAGVSPPASQEEQRALDAVMIAWFDAFHEENGLLSDEFPPF